jgi:hypothetical protein
MIILVKELHDVMALLKIVSKTAPRASENIVCRQRMLKKKWTVPGRFT